MVLAATVAICLVRPVVLLVDKRTAVDVTGVRREHMDPLAEKFVPIAWVSIAIKTEFVNRDAFPVFPVQSAMPLVPRPAVVGKSASMANVHVLPVIKTVSFLGAS